MNAISYSCPTGRPASAVLVGVHLVLRCHGVDGHTGCGVGLQEPDEVLTAYDAKYLFLIGPPSIEPFAFHPFRRAPGRARRKRSGFTFRHWRRIGRMYSRSWSIEKRFSSGSGSPSS